MFLPLTELVITITEQKKWGGCKWYDTARCLGASEYKHISVLYIEYDI